MHFISLVAVEMPKIKENQAENQEVEKCLEELREAYKQDSKNIVLELQIERLSGLTTEFARALDHSVCQIILKKVRLRKVCLSIRKKLTNRQTKTTFMIFYPAVNWKYFQRAHSRCFSL